MPDDDLRVSETLTIPAGELIWRFSRSSGPGGQSVNTSDSRAEVLFDVSASPCLTASQRRRIESRLSGRLVDGVLAIASSRQRSQWQNRREARRLLVLELQRALEPPRPARRATAPSRGAIERRLAAKKRRALTKRMRRSDDE